MINNITERNRVGLAPDPVFFVVGTNSFISSAVKLSYTDRSTWKTVFFLPLTDARETQIVHHTQIWMVGMTEVRARFQNVGSPIFFYNRLSLSNLIE